MALSETAGQSIIATDDAIAKTEQNPRQVYTQLILERLGGVDNLKETFRAQFQFNLYWEATNEEEQKWKESGEDEVNVKPSWIPVQTLFKLSNASDIIRFDIMCDTKQKDIVLMHRWNKQLWRRRYLISAEFSQAFQLESFPFDIQNFSIIIQATEHDELLQFEPVPAPDNVAISKVKKRYSSMGEWILQTASVEYTATAPELSFTGKQFSVISLDIKCIRRWKAYFYNMMLPLALLSAMGLAAFAIEMDESPESRLGYVMGTVFAIVAYQFIVRSSLPKIPYLTVMDRYVLWNFVYSLFLVLQAAVVGTVFHDVDDDILKQVDKICFVVLVVVWVVTQFIFGLYAKKARARERLKLNQCGSEISYGPSVDEFAYKTLKIYKKESRKSKFGTVYFNS
eukprot:714584_1